MSASTEGKVLLDDQVNFSSREIQATPAENKAQVFNTKTDNRIIKPVIIKNNQTKRRKKNKDEDSSKRKTEPIGLASFGLLLLTALLFWERERLV